MKIRNKIRIKREIKDWCKKYNDEDTIQDLTYKITKSKNWDELLRWVYPPVNDCGDARPKEIYEKI